MSFITEKYILILEVNKIKLTERLKLLNVYISLIIIYIKSFELSLYTIIYTIIYNYI